MAEMSLVGFWNLVFVWMKVRVSPLDFRSFILPLPSFLPLSSLSGHEVIGKVLPWAFWCGVGGIVTRSRSSGGFVSLPVFRCFHLAGLFIWDFYLRFFRVF